MKVTRTSLLMHTLAIDIGGTKFTVAAFRGEQMILRETQGTNREGGPAWMTGELNRIVDGWQTAHHFQADRCGIGFGGPVDFPSQSVTLSTHVEGWAQYPLVERIREIAGAPVVMDNDANVGALGEGSFGAGRNVDPFFYMTLSTGIGGGILSQGKVYRGANSFAGEIGHLTVEPAGPDCLCGSNGCFERLCCGLWLERDHGKTAEALMTEEAFVRQYVVYLARGLKAAIMLLNPQRIAIGGGISKAGDQLFTPLREELNRQVTSWSRANRDVVPAALADDSVLYGALRLAQVEL